MKCSHKGKVARATSPLLIDKRFIRVEISLTIHYLRGRTHG